MQNTPSYSFWKYHQFPYLLGAKVDERHFNPKDGWVARPTTFGGYWFKEVVNLPEVYGQELQTKLKLLKSARDQALKRIEDEYDEKLAAILDGFGIKR